MSQVATLWRRLTGREPARDVAPALAAHRLAQQGRDPGASLADLSFVAVDTELTGFDPRRHALVSIGAVRLRGLEILSGETFYSLVRPPGDVPKDSSLIHGLTASGLSAAPTEAEALVRFLDFLGDAVIVGHHVDLDMGFLSAACRRHLGGEIAAPCIDTLRLAMGFEEKRLLAAGGHGDAQALDYSLPALCRRYGLPEFPAHDARGDALAAAYLFVYLVRKSARGRSLSLDGLWRAGRMWWR